MAIDKKEIQAAMDRPDCRSGTRLIIWDTSAGYKEADGLSWRPGKLHTPKRNGRKFKRKTQSELEI